MGWSAAPFRFVRVLYLTFVICIRFPPQLTSAKRSTDKSIVFMADGSGQVAPPDGTINIMTGLQKTVLNGGKLQMSILT